MRSCFNNSFRLKNLFFSTYHSRLTTYQLLVTFLLIFFFGCSTPPPEIVKQDKPKPTKNEWVEQTLARLSLEEKISQMILSRSYGYYYSSKSEQYRLLHHLVEGHKIGGLIFFQGDVYETAEMLNRCQEWSDIPLLVAADFEWGSAMRIRRGTRFPEAMAVGATRDTLLAYQMGKAIGKETRAMGIHQNYAPVADVNNNPDNPVINTRSFGEDPKLVAEMACAFTAGMQSENVLATAKHFPGHGDTHVDSHIDLPSVNVSRSRLDSLELYPFRELFKRNVASVMVAHLTVLSIDSTKGLPSTLSKPFITGLLKQELGYTGLIVTDALDMGAIVNKFGSDSTAIFAVEAGTDVLLILPDEDAAIEALIHAVENGRISEERINYSVRKILGYKFDLGLVENRFVDLKNIREVVATPEHLGIAKQIARKSITVLKRDSVASILPLPSRERDSNRLSKKILNIVIADVESYRTEIQRNGNPWTNEPVGNYFTTMLKRRTNNVEQVTVDPSWNKMSFDSLLKKAKSADIVLLPIFSKARSGAGMFGIGSDVTNFIKQLSELNKPTVALALGSPYVLSVVPKANAYVCSYSDCEASTEATVEALFGEIPTQGKLPVNIPNMFAFGEGIDISQSVLRKDKPENVGFNSDSLALVDSVVNQAIRDAAFPGAQVCVVKDGAIVLNKSYGKETYGASDSGFRIQDSTIVNGQSSIVNQTMFDLASLTKVIATTSAVMKLYDEAKLGLDDKVVNFIPEFGVHGKENITIRNLLLHNSGLPAFKRLYAMCKTPQEVLDSVFNSGLIYRTGDSTVYSDFGFITLGNIVERISGQTLDEYCRKNFFEPLGMKQTMFNPPESLWTNIAPTEYDSLLRKKLVRGVVHDGNAFTLGGVSGHAGLFSTASDLAIFMQMLMNGGSYNGKQFLKHETIKFFTTKRGTNSTRALGWDTKSVEGYSSAGKFFSEKSFGHTGFTGTSIWADPERNLFVIFLANRVYPTRANTKISGVRPAVHEGVIKSLPK
ncbi:MAG: serine hydrolase [Ignavibacteriae bacterium]|nr:serine hydrolase [Ignavibacteriota bacterium]